MIDPNALAQYVGENANAFAQETDSKGRNSAVPKKPPKGQLIYCSWCGKPMYPEDFSKDPYKRKKEFKWQLHWDCQQKMMFECDRNTAGLLEERKQNGFPLGKAISYFVDPETGEPKNNAGNK